MRLFVAINLPKGERNRIHRATEGLRRAELPVRWVEPDAYHLTMRFLGEVDRDAVATVERAVETAAKMNRPFGARMGGCGAFPTMRNPRVIWLGVEPSPQLRSLRQDLEWALSEVGRSRDTRAFHPHMTLGRSSDRAGAGAFRRLGDLSASVDYEGGFEVKTLDLMRSRLGPEGSRYSIVSTSRLSAGG